jgi:hypothetical protein
MLIAFGARFYGLTSHPIDALFSSSNSPPATSALPLTLRLTACPSRSFGCLRTESSPSTSISRSLQSFLTLASLNARIIFCSHSLQLLMRPFGHFDFANSINFPGLFSAR